MKEVSDHALINSGDDWMVLIGGKMMVGTLKNMDGMVVVFGATHIPEARPSHSKQLLYLYTVLVLCILKILLQCYSTWRTTTTTCTCYIFLPVRELNPI